MSWEALKKSINGLVNKINVGNIKEIILEIFGENVIRGRSVSSCHHELPLGGMASQALVSLTGGCFAGL